MGAKFLFCMPLRAGAVLISTWQTIWSALAAAGLWFLVVEGHKKHVPHLTAYTILAGAFTAATFISAIGMVGIISKSRAIVRTLAGFLGLELVVLIASAIFTIIIIFAHKAQLIDDCNNDETFDQKTKDECLKGVNELEGTNGKIVVIVAMVVSILAHLYNMVVLHQYAHHLKEKKDDDMIPLTLGATAYDPDYLDMPGNKAHKYDPPTAGPSTPRASMTEERMLHPEVAYPYVESKHDYGETNALAAEGYRG